METLCYIKAGKDIHCDDNGEMDYQNTITKNHSSLVKKFISFVSV